MNTKHTGKSGLDSIAPEGDYVLLNSWMAVTLPDATAAVLAAKSKGDNGVVAVPIKAAMAASDLLEALQALTDEAGLYANEHRPKLENLVAAARAAIAKATGD